jgi:hypothetical protein
MWLGILVTCAFYSSTIYMTWRALQTVRRSRQAGHWPIKPGKLTRLEILEGAGDFRVDVEYIYDVQGVNYRGSTLAFGYDASSDNATHQAIYDRLREAQRVGVRFDPVRPEVSCLSSGLHDAIRIRLLICFGLFLISTSFAALLILSNQYDSIILENVSDE